MKLILSSLLSLICFLGVSQDSRSLMLFSEAPFFHGVASGDPTSNSVIIWTRVTPYSGMTTEVEVYWQIATDTAFQNVVNFGKVTTSETKDFSVKVDVCGLQDDTYYYYAFRAFERNSIIGRTKTTPVGNNTEVRYAVVHGTNYEHGFFNGYESMYNRNDLDAVLHLGDYYYEYASGGFSSEVMTNDWNRTVLPTDEAINLEDYRLRHSHYKLDNQLQLAHQIHPFITIWDDHEQANDSYKDGAENHDPTTEGPWEDRKVSSAQAYDEWMPIRTDTSGTNKVWRTLRYGNLLDLILLDTRMWERDEQNMSLTDDSTHLIMGNDQFEWMKEQLLDTTTKWKLIGNQVMFAPLEMFGTPVNADQWDGYNYQRQKLIQFISDNDIKNVVFLTGDIHSAWFNEIENSDDEVIATEYVGTSVTSPGLDVIEVAIGQLPSWLLNSLGGSIPASLKFLNAHMKYINIEDHGYMVLTVNNNLAQADLIYMEREDTLFTEDYATSWYTPANNSTLVEANSEIIPNAGPTKPPLVAIQNIPFALIEDTIYFTVNENQILNECLIDVAVCPNLSANILQNALYGNALLTDLCFEFQSITNYYGTQNFLVEICSSSMPTNCDTMVVNIEVIGINDIVNYDYNINYDSLLTDCIVFNDLTTTVDNIVFSGAGGGNFEINEITNCFNFEPDSTFCGQDQITVIACDENQICDTVILNIIVHGKMNTQNVHLYGSDHELMNNCLNYDELLGNIVSSNILYNGVNGSAVLYNEDTCISYQSNLFFNGIDTVIQYACDDFIPQKCDTIIYYFHIKYTKDTIPENTAIKELENNEFSILGIFPNPFDIEIIIQYYQFEKSMISLKLYNINGKEIYNETIPDETIGLKYARLKTENLPKGQYVLEIKNDRFSYFKKLVK